MAEDLLEEFRKHYRGRHRPEDALWWITHPDSPGPSSADPPQRLLLAAADELERNGDRQSAAALLQLTAEVLAADRRAAIDALDIARREGDARTSPQPEHRQVNDRDGVN